MRFLMLPAVLVILLMPPLAEARTKSTLRVSFGGAVVAGAAALVWSVTVGREAKNAEDKKYAATRGVEQIDGPLQDETVDSDTVAHLPVLRIRF